MERKYANFGFTMAPDIPASTAAELVAIKQVLISIIAKMIPNVRAEVLIDLEAVNNNIMNDIVMNIKKID